MTAISEARLAADEELTKALSVAALREAIERVLASLSPSAHADALLLRVRIRNVLNDQHQR